MTFEEWWEREDRVYLNEYSTFKMVAAQAWNHQQKRIDAAWEEASMDAYSRGFKAAKEIDAERVAYMEDKVRELESALKYWQDKVLNEEYDKTLTGERAV